MAGVPIPNPSNKVKLSLPLEYQQDLFQELRNNDELVILARGLGELRIVTNLLHSYDAAGNNLVIVVGADDRENGWIGESLAEHAAISRSTAARGLTLINTDTFGVATRQKLYSKGGIFSITSRILIVDLLSKLLDPLRITGLVVLHAEKVVVTSLEAFILRVFRQSNKNGFLRAFSDNPEAFAIGFAPLSSALSNLFLRKSSLWPRYHATVARSLEGQRKAEVIELEVPLTESMQEIQSAILECIDVSISELKKSGTGLELDDWTTESALNRNFDRIIRRQMDPIWHRTSFRTRQIVNDLSVLRGALLALLNYDSVSFHKYLETILATHQPPPGSTRQNQSPWLFLDAANQIFETARRRVYSGKTAETVLTSASRPLNELRPILEEQPKWKVLADVLQEVEAVDYLNPTLRGDSSGTILIMCQDQATCRQLREYLQTMYAISRKPTESPDAPENRDEARSTVSGSYLMRGKFREYLAWKKQFVKIRASLFAENQKALEGFSDQRAATLKSRAPPNKRRRLRGGLSNQGEGRPIDGALDNVAGQFDQTDRLFNQADVGSNQGGRQDVELDTMDDEVEMLEMEDVVVIHSYEGDLDEMLLEELRPRYVIMYEPDAAFIRRIEVYRSSHVDRKIRTYFMYYGGSIEEQTYLSAVRREKDSFAKVIREKGSMALTFKHDNANLDAQEQFLRTINTRIAGGGRLAATASPPIVVVDVREFRSSLASILHGQSMVVVPCMLTVADYVLSPEICVERKSIRDLIQSFKTGRLFNQAETMLQHYKYPMLLIEFDQNKSFTLEPFVDYTQSLSGGSLNPTDLQSKLVLLSIAFPRLKVIWSSSPYQTAEIFGELKKNQEEPDPLKASQIGLSLSADPNDQSFNTEPLDMLRSIPGINSKNIDRISLDVESLITASNLSLEELDSMIGSEAGRRVHRFFNKSVFEDA